MGRAQELLGDEKVFYLDLGGGYGDTYIHTCNTPCYTLNTYPLEDMKIMHWENKSKRAFS